MRSQTNDSYQPDSFWERLTLRVVRSLTNGNLPPLMLAWLLAVATAVIAHGVFQPTFSTLNDPLRSFIAKGDVAAAASDPHLVGINILIGWVLTKLYAALNFAPWYGLFMLAVQLAASAGAYYAVLAVARTRMQFILLVGIAIAVDINSMAYPQFTAIALNACAAGLLLWLAGVRLQRSLKWWEGAWSTSLLLVGFLMDEQAGIVVAGVGLPIVVYGIVIGVRHSNSSHSPWARVATMVAPLLVALLLSLAAKFVHENDYRNDRSWRGVRQEIAIRKHARKTIEFNEANRAAFEHVGWSRNDFEAFKRGLTFDRKVFSHENIAYLSNHAAGENRQNNATAFISDLFLDRRSALLAIAAICVFLFVPTNSRGMLAWVNLIGVAAISACAALNEQWTAPVFHQQVLLYLAWVALLVAEEPFYIFTRSPAKSVARKSGRGILHFGWSLTSVCCSRTLWQALLIGALTMNAVERVSRSNGEQIFYRVVREEWLESLEQLNPQADEVYVAAHGSFPYNAIAPTDSLIDHHSFNIIPLEWTQQTPIHQANLQSLGVEDLPEAMIADDRVFIFSNDETNAVIIQYMKERLGKDVVAELKHEFRIGRQFEILVRTYRVYQFREI